MNSAIRLTWLKCFVCKHEWVPRQKSIPKRCPNHLCRSTLWSKKSLISHGRRAGKKSGK